MLNDAAYEKRKRELIKTLTKDSQFNTTAPAATIVRTLGPTTLEIKMENIVALSVDAVVNAAQPLLTGGAGVDGAIHYTGGPEILAECMKIIDKIGKLETGKAVITTGGNLLAKHVIHTVGPVWTGGQNHEPELLASCYRECLRIADENQLSSIGFPSISSGSYGYPVLQAAEVALQTVKAYLTSEPTGLCKVVFAIFSHVDMGAYRRAVQKIIG